MEVLTLAFATLALIVSVLSWFKAHELDGYMNTTLILLREIAIRVTGK